jgi:hypothetical protein
MQTASDLDAAGGYRQTLGLFSQADVTASQSAVALAIHAGDAALTEIPVPRAGSVTGISARTEGARTGGTCTVDVTKNGTATGLQAVIDATNTQQHQATQAKDTDTFAAGDRIGVDITTDASWAAGSTPSIIVTVEVEM